MPNPFHRIIAKAERFKLHIPALLSILAGLYLSYITFPKCVYTAGYGLDISWQYAINYIPTSKFIFGKDTNFTYGPLGYLIFPMNVGSNLVHGFIFAVLSQGMLGFLLFNHFLNQKNIKSIILLTIGLSISYALLGWTEYDNRFYTLFWFLIASTYFSPKSRHFCLIFVGLISGLSIFEKFNIGVSALFGSFLLHCVFLIERVKDKKTYLLAPLTFMIVVAWQVTSHFRSLPNLFDWVKASLQIAGEYSVAMSAVGPSHQVSWGLICLAGYVAYLCLLYYKRSALRHIALIFFPQVFFLFKSGFIRQDPGHLVIFFCSLPSLPIILASYGKTKSDRIACGFLFLLFLSFDIVTVRRAVKAFSVEQSVSRLAGVTGQANFSNAIRAFQHPPPLMPEASAEAARLPIEWCDLIRKENETVGILPWEISLAPANSLNWKPNPVLQQYSAYTPSLDQLGANYFANQNVAPNFLIVDFVDIDGRHPLWASPKTWESVFANYVPIQTVPNRFLLRRREKPMSAAPQRREIGRDEIKAGRWINVPETPYPLFARLNLRPRYLGIATKFFFRIPPLLIEAEYKNGRQTKFRFMPSAAETGIMMNNLPDGNNLNTLFGNDFSNERISRIRFVGQGIYYYRNSILMWDELDQKNFQ